MYTHEPRATIIVQYVFVTCLVSSSVHQGVSHNYEGVMGFEIYYYKYCLATPPSPPHEGGCARCNPPHYSRYRAKKETPDFSALRAKIGPPFFAIRAHKFLTGHGNYGHRYRSRQVFTMVLTHVKTSRGTVRLFERDKTTARGVTRQPDSRAQLGALMKQTHATRVALTTTGAEHCAQLQPRARNLLEYIGIE